MAISVSTVIYASIDDVIMAFIDNEEVKKREGFKDIKLIEGIQNTVGAKYLMEYHQGTFHTKVIREIALPSKITFFIEEIGEVQEYTFREHDDHVHFKLTLSYEGFVPKLGSFLIKSKLMDKANIMMNNTKEYCEN